ncbi:MAG: hypothetical protein GY834_17200 [Bacteroidetes bacterium]|nr:hypothetical protein [Bacteroidota bacterium]
MYRFFLKLLIISLLLIQGVVIGQDNESENTPVDIEKPIAIKDNVIETIESKYVGNILDTTIIIPKLEFVGLKLDDALKALVRAYELSVFIDTSVTGTITLRLDQVSLNDALLFIIKEYDLEWERTGEIIKIFKPTPPVLPPAPLEMTIENGNISYNFNQVSLQRVVDELIEKTRVNIIIENSTNGRLSGKLVNVLLDKGLGILFSSNGFILRLVEDIYYISSQSETGKSGSRASRFSIRCEDELVSINVSNAPLGDVISTIGDQCQASFFTRDQIEGNVSANFENLTMDEALSSLLRNTQYTFKKDKGIYFFGTKTSEDMFVSELILLKHLVAKDVEPLIPTSLTKQLSLKIVIEHNGFIAVGPKTVIEEVRLFLSSIDIPPAMVLFDVLVVDYSNTDTYTFDLLMNNTGGNDLPTQTYYPDVNISGTGKTLKDELDWVGNRLGISNIGPLSDNFFAQLQIMQKEGKANVRSRPKIASLCGHAASINVGTTQYYLLETQTVHSNVNTNNSTQTSQRFETIEANMNIEVTPYVNETGELIVDIAPEFSTPSAQFDPDVPPTINHRILKSTVRLKNGETIILGGLVQTTENKTTKKFPILGSLPLIGPLFQSHDNVTNSSELMIYITPHVYYGSEQNVDLDAIIKKE